MMGRSRIIANRRNDYRLEGMAMRSNTMRRHDEELYLTPPMDRTGPYNST